MVGQAAVTDAAVGATSFSIAILGPMEVGGQDRLQLRDHIVLGVLVVRTGAVVTVEQIGIAIWGDALPASYRKVIQGGVMRLRRGEMSKADRKRLRGATVSIFDDPTHRARLTVPNMNDVVDVASLLLG